MVQRRNCHRIIVRKGHGLTIHFVSLIILKYSRGWRIPENTNIHLEINKYFYWYCLFSTITCMTEGWCLVPFLILIFLSHQWLSDGMGRSERTHLSHSNLTRLDRGFNAKGFTSSCHPTPNIALSRNSIKCSTFEVCEVLVAFYSFPFELVFDEFEIARPRTLNLLWCYLQPCMMAFLDGCEFISSSLCLL